jgi:hypothetical protein
MSKWFWVISMQQAIGGGRGMQSTTIANECDLPDGVSRRIAFEEIVKAATQMAGWQGIPTVLFFSLEPAALPTGGGAS